MNINQKKAVLLHGLTDQADIKARRTTRGILHNDEVVNLPGSNTDRFAWI